MIFWHMVFEMAGFCRLFFGKIKGESLIFADITERPLFDLLPSRIGVRFCIARLFINHGYFMRRILWWALMVLLMARMGWAGEISGALGVNGYFKPSLQVWRIVSVSALSPANIPADLRGIPTILRGTYLIFGEDFFAKPSLNSWDNYGYAAACFRHEGSSIEVNMSDARKHGVFRRYKMLRLGQGYFYVLDDLFQVSIEPAPLSAIKKETLAEIQAGIPANKEDSYGRVLCGFNSRVIRSSSDDELFSNFFITAIKPSRLEGNTYIYEPDRKVVKTVEVKKPVKKCPLLSAPSDKAGKEAFSKKLALSSMLSDLVEVGMARSLKGIDAESSCGRNAVRTEDIQQELDELPLGNVVETYSCFVAEMTALVADNNKNGCKP